MQGEHKTNSNGSFKWAVHLTGFLTMCEAMEKSSSTLCAGTRSSLWMGLWRPEQNASHRSREAKCTQAVRELASQQVQGDRKGFAPYRLTDGQSEIRYQPGWQPQEAAPSSDPPCAVSWKSWGVAAAQTWAVVTPEMVVFMSGHGNQYCTGGQIS